MQKLLAELVEEAADANAVYGRLASAHEGFGVLYEEVMKLLEAICQNHRSAVRREAIQVSAVALRIAACCEDDAYCERSSFRGET